MKPAHHLPLLAFALAACEPLPDGVDCTRHHDNGPDGPPSLTLLQVDPERSEVANSHLLMDQSDGPLSWVTAVDGCGAHRWWRPPSDPAARIYRAHLSDDGERILYAEHNRAHRPDTGRLLELDVQSDTIVRTTRMTEAHHDFTVLPDNKVAWISWQYLTNQWFPNLPADVVTDAVRVAPLGSQEEIVETTFSLYDSVPGEPWWSCSHMTPTEAVPGYAEWSHANSLMWEPASGQMVLHSRHWNALTSFDRSGRLAWVMGGPQNQFEFIGTTQMAQHAHLSEVWDGGMLVFDNRNHDPAGTSRVVEYAIDEVAKTVEEVWSYEDGTFVSFLGDARRLPGGNVLIVWSAEGRMTEVTREGEVVWEAASEGRLSRVEVHPGPWTGPVL